MPAFKDEPAHPIGREDRHDRADHRAVAVAPHPHPIDLQCIQQLQQIIGVLPVKIGVEADDVR